MTDVIEVHRGRTVKVPIHLQYSVLGDDITSEIRVGVDPASTLIATWDVEISPNGRVINLSLDNSVTQGITQSGGWMDIKRVTGGEPVNVLDTPIPVVFRNVVTS